MPDRKFSSHIWLHHPKLQIGAHARDFLSRLILVADDHGSHPALPITLRHTCYPAELGVRVTDVTSWIKKAQSTGALAIFETPAGPVLKIAEDIWKCLVLYPNSKVSKASKFLAHEQGELPLPESGKQNITPIWAACTSTSTVTTANTCTPAESAQRPTEAKPPLRRPQGHGSSERKGKHDKTTRAEAAIAEAREAEALGQSYEEIEIIKMLGFMEWGTNEGMWRLRMKEDLPALMRVVRDWKSQTPDEQHSKKNRGAWATELFWTYSPQSRPENRKKA